MRRVAGDAAVQIDRLLRLLGAKMRELARAIEPHNLRVEADKLADALSQLTLSKLWVYRIDQYCRMSASERLQFQNQVQSSIRLVEEARSELDKLQDKLD